LTWAALVAALPQELELHLAGGAVHRYRLERVYASEDGTETTKFGEDWEVELDKEDPHRATFRRRLTALVVDGRPLPVKPGDWTVSSARIGDDGTVSSRVWDTEDGLAFARHMRPTEIRLRGGALEVGTVWQVREGAAPEGVLAPASWRFQVASASEATVRVEASFAEEGDSTAVRAQGWYELDPATRWPVRTEFLVRPVTSPLDEEGVPCTLRVTLERS
jgi:hypothetical protein